jgi:hypothetical protein
MTAKSADEARASVKPVKASNTPSTPAQGTATGGFDPSAISVSYITSFLPGDNQPTKMTETQLNKMLIEMTPQERIAYATKLKAAGYSVGPLTGAVTKDLRRAWLNAHSDLTTEIQAGQALDLNTFLTANAGTGGSGTGGAGTSIAKSQINDTAASALINSVYQDLAGQKASPAEIAKYTKQLRAAQAKNPVKTVYDGTGKSSTSGGIDTQQFLTEKLQGTAPVEQQRTRNAMTLMMQELGGLR